MKTSTFAFLFQLNNQVLYGLSHLNAAPLIRSIYMEVIGRSSNIFRRSKCNALRFVIQRHSSNTNLMAALATNQHADVSDSNVFNKLFILFTLIICTTAILHYLHHESLHPSSVANILIDFILVTKVSFIIFMATEFQSEVLVSR